MSWRARSANRRFIGTPKRDNTDGPSTDGDAGAAELLPFTTHLDLAKAYTQWGKYDLAYDALREAEVIAPQELRRPQVKAMIRRIDMLAPGRIRQDLAELNLRVATK